MIRVFINILFLVRRKSRKCFQRRRNEKSLRATALRTRQVFSFKLKKKIFSVWIWKSLWVTSQWGMFSLLFG